MLAGGYKIVVFCAQTERDVSISNIKFCDNLELVCDNLNNFLKELSKVDLLVGLESFLFMLLIFWMSLVFHW